MKAEITTAREYGTDLSCQIGRIVYRVGIYDYVALTFRYLDPPTKWRLTWIGEKGERPARIPEGVFPNGDMLAALAEAM